MFEEGKKFKDSEKDFEKDTTSMPAPYQAVGFSSGSYTKTNKLITALYMVTDIMDKDEPLRNKLRTLGTEIISDMNSNLSNVCNKILGVVSFLDIASAINIISEMNCNILKKEFLKLDQSIKELNNKKTNLAELFESPPSPEGLSLGLGTKLRSGVGEDFFNSPHPRSLLNKERGNVISKGHTRIGVQKGSTLLKAIEKMSNRVPAPYVPPWRDHLVSDRKLNHTTINDFDILKKQRRNEINNFIQKKGGDVTITDIKNGAYGSLTSCSEKTLQRELASMVKDGVLDKKGEKRWSRYFIKN